MRPALLLLLVSGAALAQRHDPRPALVLTREQTRTDSGYARNEREIVRACARLSCPHPYVAYVDRKNGEVWWLSTFASDEEKSRVEREWERNASLAPIQELGRRKTTLRQLIGTTNAVWRRGPLVDLTRAPILVVATRSDSVRLEGTIFEDGEKQFIAMVPARDSASADSIARRMGSRSRVLTLRPEWSHPMLRWPIDSALWQPYFATLRETRTGSVAAEVDTLLRSLPRWLTEIPSISIHRNGDTVEARYTSPTRAAAAGDILRVTVASFASDREARAAFSAAQGTLMRDPRDTRVVDGIQVTRRDSVTVTRLGIHVLSIVVGAKPNPITADQVFDLLRGDLLAILPRD